MATDVVVQNHGTVFLFIPVTPAAENWIRQWVDDGYEAGALTVEHRFVEDIAVGMINDGLEVV